MAEKHLIYVEHFIKDREGWDDMTQEWMDYFRAPDMNIDKALQYPAMEYNECILTCPDTKGVMTFCLWKVPSTMTMTGFQDFIDRFTRGYATSKCYAVDAAMGIQNLDPRGYARSVINSANGRNPGYLDAPMLWFVHHHVTDAEGWAKTMDDLATKISKCENPSDVKAVEFEEGYGCPFSLMLGEKDVVCLWSAPEGTTREKFFEAVGRFTNGATLDVPYEIKDEYSWNVANLAEDNYSIDVLKWAKSTKRMNMKTIAGVGAVADQNIHIATQ